LLISPDLLRDDGLLDARDLSAAPRFPDGRADYGGAAAYKNGLLRRAYERFRGEDGFEHFCGREAVWLDDYALYAALKESHGGRPWTEWAPELARREPEALAQARADLGDAVHFQKWAQWVFHEQYMRVRRAANARGIRIVGDLPIFVALDSADVWAHPELFSLDEAGRPAVVAGVPPDYFSATGQLWGNPLYRWDALERDGYGWWVRRMRRALDLYDLVRIDHFRGFESYWEVRAGETTALNGRWAPGPGDRFFAALRNQLGALPIIAEDLGLITPEVHALRDRLGLPGMKVVQFAFSDPENPYLPHNHVPNSVVCTGTHDNDTTRGWWAGAPPEQQVFARRYLGRPYLDAPWDFIRVALGSASDLAIVPVQDVLGLGSEARMNRPGEAEGNWEWRMRPGALTPALAARLRELAELYDR
jgi:4-alpha-glucanotransferase